MCTDQIAEACEYIANNTYTANTRKSLALFLILDPCFSDSSLRLLFRFSVTNPFVSSPKMDTFLTLGQEETLAFFFLRKIAKTFYDTPIEERILKAPFE